MMLNNKLVMCAFLLCTSLTLAVVPEGVIIGWGSDDNFQHPEFDTESHYQATPPDANDYFVSVDAGMYHSIAVKSDGSLLIWGDDNYDQVSGFPGGSGFEAVAAGYYHSVVIKSDFSLEDWGDNYYGQLDGTPAGTNFIAVAAGGEHSLALTSGGSLAAWG
ncbi:MAG: RCC1 domain-containing protein, partial [Planctomycetota bacterium]